MRTNCKNCNVKLTQENTYKAPKWLCKECCRASRRASYQRRKDKIIAAHEKYRKTPRGIEVERKKSKLQYEKFKDKDTARMKFYYLVRSGKIVKPTSCKWSTSRLSGKECSGRIEAHHKNGYEGDNWKIVDWLCKHHHVLTHQIEE
ncbi:MAG TPA: hypothetical protein VF941_14265 [Clostridia bacterium]